jgi:hypothetical protein
MSDHLAGAHLFPLNVNFPNLQTLSLEVHNTFETLVFKNLTRFAHEIACSIHGRR